MSRYSALQLAKLEDFILTTNLGSKCQKPGFTKGWARGKLSSCHWMILLAWYDHLEESSSYMDFQCKMFCPLVKPSYVSAENIKLNPCINRTVMC